MTDKYFAFDSETGFDTFATAEEAQLAAEQSIQEYRDYAHEGWDELADNVCWGKISQQSVMYSTGDTVEFEGEQVECVDYKLVAI